MQCALASGKRRNVGIGVWISWSETDSADNVSKHQVSLYQVNRPWRCSIDCVKNIYISLTWQENFKVSQCVVRMGVVAWVLLLCLCLKTTTMKLMIRSRSFWKKKNFLMVVLISCFETPPLSQCKGRKWTPSAIFLFICWSVLFRQHYWNSVPLERSERENYLRQIFRYLDKPFGYRS